MESYALSLDLARLWLRAMAGRVVVVVGDVFLDEYWVGRAERLSREGPVPVLAYSHRFCLAGGGANPARNIAALGGTARLVGVVGADAAAAELCGLLAAGGIDPSGLLVDPSRPTSVKTRMVAEGLAVPQQIARMDRLSRRLVSGEVEAALTTVLDAQMDRADAILVSHYRSGVVTPTVSAAARQAARKAGVWLTVDAQGDLSFFHGFDLVRVGRHDAAASLNQALETEADFEAAARGLRETLGARVVMLGRGAAGMSVADESGYVLVRPSNVSEVFDVAGAGDTVIAVVTLALAAGAPVGVAVALANVAAGIVVRRLGVAAPTADEILAEVERSEARAG